jgi:hypothetical protein
LFDPVEEALYVRGSPRVKHIDDIIAADARLPVDYSELGSLHREEKARAASEATEH